jgi:hypothetical protein
MTKYARNVNDWQGEALTDDERARWVRGRPDLRNDYAASGHNMPGYLDANRDHVDAVIVGDVAPWGERGELQYNETGLPVVIRGTCGTCGAAWNDTLITAISPLPSARCPFENEHDDPGPVNDAVYHWPTPAVRITDLVEIARALIEPGDGASDPEYERGIAELIADAAGLYGDGMPQVRDALGI